MVQPAGVSAGTKIDLPQAQTNNCPQTNQKHAWSFCYVLLCFGPGSRLEKVTESWTSQVLWITPKFLSQHIQASGKQTPGWFEFISNRNPSWNMLLATFKVIQTKEVDECSISVAQCSRSDTSCCYWGTEGRRQTTSDVQQIKNYYYTKKKNQRGHHRADKDEHWGIDPDMAGSGSACAWADTKHWLTPLWSCSLFSSIGLWSHLGSQMSKKGS